MALLSWSIVGSLIIAIVVKSSQKVISQFPSGNLIIFNVYVLLDFYLNFILCNSRCFHAQGRTRTLILYLATSPLCQAASLLATGNLF